MSLSVLPLTASGVARVSAASSAGIAEICITGSGCGRPIGCGGQAFSGKSACMPSFDRRGNGPRAGP
jgi:hypothetical protein